MLLPKQTARRLTLNRRVDRVVFCLIALTWLCEGTGAAQTSAPIKNESSSTWVSYIGEHPFSKNWTFHIEGYGTWLGPTKDPDFFFLRPGIGRQLNGQLSILVAYSYFRFFPARTTASGSLPEHRISTDIQWEHPLSTSGHGEVILIHRLRQEYRFVAVEDTITRRRDLSFSPRTRYRANVVFPLKRDAFELTPSYLSFYDEVFLNTRSGQTRFLTQNLTSGALGWKLGPHVNMEIGYVHQYDPSPRGSVGVHNHVLTLTLFSRIPLGTKSAMPR